jgi:hypothetical protein
MLRSLIVAAALVAAGAATAQPGPEAGLFISPAGEPFRAQPGETYPLPKWFAGADADHDGALTPTEFDKDGQRFFDVLDTNHDGKLNNIELAAYETDVAPEIVRKIPLLSDRSGRGTDAMRTLPPRRGAPTRLRPPAEGAGFYSLLNEPQPVTAPDLDFNTIVTRQEWSAAAKRRFTRLDKNADFKLTLDELPVPPVAQTDEPEQ